jgi:hypothetical protein
MESLAIALFMLLLVVPLALIVRLVAALFSRGVRDSIVRHPGMHLIWLALAVSVVLFVMLMPASRHRRPGAPRSNHPATGKAGIARLLAVEHHAPGLPEPGRRGPARVS